MPPQKETRFGIAAKILTAMLLVAVVPIAVSGYINHLAMIREITHQVESKLTGVSENLTVYVDGWVEMNRRMLAQNAALESISSMEPERQNQALKTIPETYPWTYLAFTCDTGGMNIGRSDEEPLKDYSDRVYVKQVQNGAALGQQVLVGKTSGVPALVLAAPIRSGEDRLRGIIAIAMKISDISRRITGAKIGKTGFAFLLDATGKVIAHPFEEFSKTRKDLTDHPAFVALKTEGRDHLVFTNEAGKKVIAFSNKTDRGWIMVVQQDYAEAFLPVEAANRNGLIILLLTLVAVPLVAYPLSRRLTTPLRDLTEVADEFSKGALERKVPEIRRKDEIGALARAIDRLGVSVKYAMERIERSSR